MFTTAIIAFREFLEAFLLIGIFIGIDRKLHLGKQKEILTAASIGITLSLILPIIVFLFANGAKGVFTEKNTDVLEGYLLTFSGLFLAYVVFSLHASMKNFRDRAIANAHSKMEQQIFDVSLFLTIVFFIAREGFEVALLITTTSLFSAFLTNIIGLMIGFVAASLIGLSTVLMYVKLPIKKVFQFTEYFILIIGAAMVKNGSSILLEKYTHFRPDTFFPLSLKFLPGDATVLGHTLKNLFGLQREMSLSQILIMGVYIIVVYYLFFMKKSPAKIKA